MKDIMEKIVAENARTKPIRQDREYREMIVRHKTERAELDARHEYENDQSWRK